jgi:hypothetical protein
MNGKKKKYFDSVQMTQDIRDAIFRQKTDPNFDPLEFKRIKEKWTKRLKQEQATLRGLKLSSGK